MLKQDVIDYYQSSQWLYRLFCYDNETLGMHFGFWDKDTADRQQAILNENDAIIKSGAIKKDMRVLDAGCGVGGTAIYVAEKTGARVWGISIDPQQIILAKKYARERNVEKLVNFSVQDYSKTKFPNDYFNVVYGIESICHATPKINFLREAYRILKPRGKLVAADAHLTHQPINKLEKKLIDDFIWSFSLNELATQKQIVEQIRLAGFKKIISKNVTPLVEPSIRYYARLAHKMELLAKISRLLPNPKLKAIYRNYLALKLTGEIYKRGLVSYFINIAEKI